jgi:hypothetical protein
MSPTLRFVPSLYAAVISGRKTQTRRVFTPQPTEGCGLLPGPCELYHPAIERHGMLVSGLEVYGIATEDEGWIATYGPPRTVLPIVTTWAAPKKLDDLPPCKIGWGVLEDHSPTGTIKGSLWFSDGTEKPDWAGKSRPAMFFPKALYPFARQAHVTAVKAERVQGISDLDAIAEGIAECDGAWMSYSPKYNRCVSPVTSYRTLWDSINATRGKGENKGQYAWDNNPWVFATTFELV